MDSARASQDSRRTGTDLVASCPTRSACRRTISRRSRSSLSENGIQSPRSSASRSSARGDHHATPEYLVGAQRLCRENDVAFVVDEVITGFGRTGAMSRATARAQARRAADREGNHVRVPAVGGYGRQRGALGAVLGGGRRACLPARADVRRSRQRLRAAMANCDIIEREGLVERVPRSSPSSTGTSPAAGGTRRS